MAVASAARKRTNTGVELLAWVRGVDHADALEGYRQRLADAAGAILDTGAGALEASRAIATLNDALTERLLTLAESDLGPPPARYAWLALGSQGRQEQALLSDQDNALAYAAGAPGADPDEARAYFAGLAERVVAGLHRAGFPYCPGGYMATNWHRPLPDWQATFRTWLDRPSSQGVVEAEVFLDFRRIHGELDVDALDAILRTSADRARFQLLMARAAVTFRPPLRFGRIHQKQVDLKRHGLAPIVLLARLYALSGRSLARRTPERLEAAAAGGQLSRQGAAELTEAYRVLTELRLQTQLHDIAADRPATNVVTLTDLTAAQRGQLTKAFHTVRDHQQATEMHFHTEAIS